MSGRDLKFFLALQIFAVIWAGMVFSLIEARVWAGALAGGYFLGAGLFMLARIWKWPRKWKSLTLYPLFLHVFLISIPLLVSRFLQIGKDFEAVQVLGLEGPVFHRLSTMVFSALIAATLLDLVRVWRGAQSLKSKPVQPMREIR
ncbi:MAG: hypothetical protein AB7G93_17455 [Bdellovibrionales bacterium]